jgi:hypothetical protein
VSSRPSLKKDFSVSTRIDLDGLLPYFSFLLTSTLPKKIQNLFRAELIQGQPCTNTRAIKSCHQAGHVIERDIIPDCHSDPKRISSGGANKFDNVITKTRIAASFRLFDLS